MELDITPSNTLLSGFIILPILITCWWVWACGRAYGVAGSKHKPLSPSYNNSTKAPFNLKVAGLAAVIFVIWLTSAAFVGFQDWAHDFESFPPLVIRVFLVFIVVTIFIALSKIGKVIALSTPLWLIIGFQTFRIPLELLIFQAYSENITIVEMTYLGRNFDIVTGILALAIAAYTFKKEISNKIILIWNIFGLAMLINVVGTGILSMPHAFQVIKTDFPNIWVTFFPFIWLPYVLVCSALFGHLLVFRYLLAQKNNQDI